MQKHKKYNHVNQQTTAQKYIKLNIGRARLKYIWQHKLTFPSQFEVLDKMDQQAWQESVY